MGMLHEEKGINISCLSIFFIQSDRLKQHKTKIQLSIKLLSPQKIFMYVSCQKGKLIAIMQRRKFEDFVCREWLIALHLPS